MKLSLPAISLISALNITALTACKHTPPKPVVITKYIRDPVKEMRSDSAANSDHFLEVEMPMFFMNGTHRRVRYVFYNEETVVLTLEDRSSYKKKCKDGSEGENIDSKIHGNYCFDKCSAELVRCAEHNHGHK